MAYDLSPTAQRTKRWFEVPILIAAVLVIPVVFLEQSEDPGLRTLGLALDWLIWATFAVEYVVMLRLVDDRWQYTKSAWLDVLIIVGSFPLIRALTLTRTLRIWRLGPALRVLRLVRLAGLITRGGIAAKHIFKRSGIGYFAALLTLLALGAGAGIAMIEPDVTSPVDGIWWAVVTVTTVGYGDIAPATPAGRLAAGALMALGIGFTALLTAAITAHYINEDDIELTSDVEDMSERLTVIEEKLDRLLDAERRFPHKTTPFALRQQVTFQPKDEAV